jgi:hypothetical protein
VKCELAKAKNIKTSKAAILDPVLSKCILSSSAI